MALDQTKKRISELTSDDLSDSQMSCERQAPPKRQIRTKVNFWNYNLCKYDQSKNDKKSNYKL